MQALEPAARRNATARANAHEAEGTATAGQVRTEKAPSALFAARYILGEAAGGGDQQAAGVVVS